MTNRYDRRHVGQGRGFTLIEVMIVILIIVAIGGLVAFNAIGSKKKADTGLATADFNTLKSTLKQFYFEHNRYPTDEEGIKVLWDKAAMTDEEAAKKWTKLLEAPMAKDRWGNEWQYRQKSEHGDEDTYDLWSAGPDKQEGNEDDIVSWTKEEGAGGEGAKGSTPKKGG